MFWDIFVSNAKTDKVEENGMFIFDVILIIRFFEVLAKKNIDDGNKIMFP